MSNLFFISDTHFGHKNIIKFKKENGEMLRDFNSIEEMNEKMIENWNKVVSNQDKVIHCGDVAFGKDALKLCHRLKGIKYLVMGNHDNMDMNEYAKIFVKIFGIKYIGRNIAICSHAPLHSLSMRSFAVNIHGHLHDKRIMEREYFNVSVEQINYTPIELEEIKERLK
jgi:calcineurin-like phosphoesterase family protein